MSGFEELKDVSNFITNELQRSTVSFTAKVSRNREEIISKKIRDIKLYSAKLNLLQAKPLSSNLIPKEQQFKNVLDEYRDTVMWKVIENVTAKSLTQTHAVHALITTPDESLHSEMKQKKKAIIDRISVYHSKELVLRKLETQLKQREAKIGELTAQWDRTLGTLWDLKEQTNSYDEGDRGPLYKILRRLVEKLEIMRWLMSQLVTARTQNYDWLTDPHIRLSALALSRKPNTVDMFTSTN